MRAWPVFVVAGLCAAVIAFAMTRKKNPLNLKVGDTVVVIVFEEGDPEYTHIGARGVVTQLDLGNEYPYLVEFAPHISVDTGNLTKSKIWVVPDAIKKVTVGEDVTMSGTLGIANPFKGKIKTSGRLKRGDHVVAVFGLGPDRPPVELGLRGVITDVNFDPSSTLPSYMRVPYYVEFADGDSRWMRQSWIAKVAEEDVTMSATPVPKFMTGDIVKVVRGLGPEFPPVKVGLQGVITAVDIVSGSTLPMHRLLPYYVLFPAGTGTSLWMRESWIIKVTGEDVTMQSPAGMRVKTFVFNPMNPRAWSTSFSVGDLVEVYVRNLIVGTIDWHRFGVITRIDEYTYTGSQKQANLFACWRDSIDEAKAVAWQGYVSAEQTEVVERNGGYCRVLESGILRDDVTMQSSNKFREGDRVRIISDGGMEGRREHVGKICKVTAVKDKEGSPIFYKINCGHYTSWTYWQEDWLEAMDDDVTMQGEDVRMSGSPLIIGLNPGDRVRYIYTKSDPAVPLGVYGILEKINTDPLDNWPYYIAWDTGDKYWARAEEIEASPLPISDDVTMQAPIAIGDVVALRWYCSINDTEQLRPGAQGKVARLRVRDDVGECMVYFDIADLHGGAKPRDQAGTFWHWIPFKHLKVVRDDVTMHSDALAFEIGDCVEMVDADDPEVTLHEHGVVVGKDGEDSPLSQMWYQVHFEKHGPSWVAEDSVRKVLRDVTMQASVPPTRSELASRLITAARSGDMKAVKQTIADGADIRYMDGYAMRTAALYGNLDIVKLLVEMGVDVNAREDLAVRWAASKNFVDIVKFLVQRGAGHFDEAIAEAERFGGLDVVKYLKHVMQEDVTMSATPWKSGSDYGGHDYTGWLVITSHTRDSGFIDESNWSAWVEMLKPFKQVETVRFGHFAVGWIESMMVEESEMTPELKTIIDATDKRLDDYPILDEEDWSQREYDATLENIKDAARSYIKDNPREGWESEVFHWFWDNDQSAVEASDDAGGYPSKDQIKAALKALKLYDYAGQDEVAPIDESDVTMSSSEIPFHSGDRVRIISSITAPDKDGKRHTAPSGTLGTVVNLPSGKSDELYIKLDSPISNFLAMRGDFLKKNIYKIRLADDPWEDDVTMAALPQFRPGTRVQIMSSITVAKNVNTSPPEYTLVPSGTLGRVMDMNKFSGLRVICDDFGHGPGWVLSLPSDAWENNIKKIEDDITMQSGIGMPAQSTFQPGDTVKVVRQMRVWAGGQEWTLLPGMVGTVQTIGKNIGVRFDIGLQADLGLQRAFITTLVNVDGIAKVVSDVTMSAKPRFKVGDQVKVVAPQSPHYGEIHTIIEITEVASYGFECKLDIARKEVYPYFHESRLALVAEDVTMQASVVLPGPRFTKGERVRVVKPSLPGPRWFPSLDAYVGREGFVEDTTKDAKGWWHRLSESKNKSSVGFGFRWHESWLEAFSNDVTMSTFPGESKFLPGDLVKIIYGKGGNFETERKQHIGTIAVIDKVETFQDGIWYVLKRKDGTDVSAWAYWSGAWLELVEDVVEDVTMQSLKPRFAPGDRVVLNGKWIEERVGTYEEKNISSTSINRDKLVGKTAVIKKIEPITEPETGLRWYELEIADPGIPEENLPSFWLEGWLSLVGEDVTMAAGPF